MKKIINLSTLLIFGLLAILTFNSTLTAQTRDEVWIIADRRADCAGVGAIKCLQIKKPQDEKWTLLAQNIENFKYETGYTYVVRVKTATIKNPPADASNLRYTLKKVLSREKTGGVVILGNGGRNDDGANKSELNGKSWRLTAIDGNAVSTDKATLIFNVDGKSVGGNGGCNGFGGNLTINGDKITINQIISTKMFCEDTSPVENKYLSKLEQATQYRIADGKLQLLNDQNIVLEFIIKN